MTPMTTYLKKNKPQRRTVILGLAAACIHVAAPVWALSTAQAKKLVGNVVDDINTVIQSGQSEPAILADFEKIFQRYADVKTIARYALGVTRAAHPRLRWRLSRTLFQVTSRVNMARSLMNLSAAGLM